MAPSVRLASILGLSCLAFLLAAPLAAAPIEAGARQQTVTLGEEKIPVFLYRPSCENPSLLLVFHGVARNAGGYRNYARPLADQLCFVVLAPKFDRKEFPVWRYQQGGIKRKNGTTRSERDWTGQFVIELVDWARKQEGKALPYSLLGHSAGAQFLSRVAAFTPKEARRIVIVNPSSYVLAATDVAAPYGLGDVYGPEKSKEALKRYLATPVTIMLGQEDVGDKNLSETPEAKAQAATRYERGLNTFKAAREMAERQRLPFNWRLVEVPGVAHNAKKMFSSKQALNAIEP